MVVVPVVVLVVGTRVVVVYRLQSQVVVVCEVVVLELVVVGQASGGTAIPTPQNVVVHSPSTNPQ